MYFTNDFSGNYIDVKASENYDISGTYPDLQPGINALYFKIPRTDSAADCGRKISFNVQNKNTKAYLEVLNTVNNTVNKLIQTTA